MKTLKVLSALLAYPTPELQAAAAELEAVLRSEALLPAPHIDGVCDLIRDLAGRDILDAEERYVLLFDRTRSLSLHLFEHVHGESRDRGQAMVDLLKLYEDAGYRPTAAELPDYLPLFLEFASTRPPAEALAARPADDPVDLDVATAELLLAFASREHRHLAIENAIVMVIARRRLTSADLAAMSRAMKARRGIAS